MTTSVGDVKATLYINKDHYEWLRGHAHRTGRSMSKAANRIFAAAQEAERTQALAQSVNQAGSAITIDQVATVARELGPEAGLQALLLAAGAGLDLGRSPL